MAGNELAVWRPARNSITCSDALKFLWQMPSESVHCVVDKIPYYGIMILTVVWRIIMRGKSGRFTKGHHWRQPKDHWDKEWLHTEYVVNQRSTGDIAAQQGCTDANILHFLRKHGIKRRTISEARSVKQWSLSGETNGMYGRTGEQNPNWRGGISPERQAFYSSIEWGSVAKQVWKRDKAICQFCGKQARRRSTFHIHHITSFEVKHLRTKLNNLVLLCPECHHWVHSNKNIHNEFVREHE